MHRHLYPDVTLVDFVEGLSTTLPARTGTVVENPPRPEAWVPVPGAPVTIERLIMCLNAFIDERTTVVADVGDALFASIDLLVEAWDFIAPAYYLSLGFAVPGSIGVQLARPGTRPLVIVGDGAFQMTGTELTSAVRYGLDPIVIVLDNAGYGTERPMLDGPFNDVVPWHYERLPELLGTGRGYDVRTEDDLDAALSAARSERGEYALLRVHLEPDDMSPALRRLTTLLGERVKAQGHALRSQETRDAAPAAAAEAAEGVERSMNGPLAGPGQRRPPQQAAFIHYQEVCMKELKERVRNEGKNLGGGILKVDGFINHQVDPVLMDACGQEFAKRFKDVGATKILTAEISGIAPAVATGLHMQLPVVYARKRKPITMPDQVLLTLSPSHTKGHTVELIVSPEYLAGGERVLIIDDFLASGATILGLVRLAQAAGAILVGIGTLIEKNFEGGRQALSFLDIPVEALVRIQSMEGSQIQIES